MLLQDLLNDHLADLDDFYIKKEKYKELILEKKAYIKENYSFIFDFINSGYFEEYKNIQNKSFEHKHYSSKNSVFHFSGFNEKGYLIYSYNYLTRFYINEDLNGTFFYLLDAKKDKPLFRIKFNKDLSDFEISFFTIENACILNSFDINGNQITIAQIIDENDKIFENVKFLEFFNHKFNSATTSEKYRNYFQSKAMYKISFIQNKPNNVQNCSLFFADDNYVFKDFKNTKAYREAYLMGINILNPLFVNIDDIELLELNFNN
tara:strand:+ start:6592 stop:7380 length:789 start_codon:yes stop_codon:yes gene_type:complete